MVFSKDAQPAIFVREVEVRTWPLRTDIEVRGFGNLPFLHYRLDDLPPEPHPLLFDPRAEREDRVRAAIADAERMQSILRIEWGADEQTMVVLQEHPEPMGALSSITAEHGIALSDLKPDSPEFIISSLLALDVESHWELTCDWFDRAIRHMPAGSSRDEGVEWCLRAHPDDATNYSRRTGGDVHEAMALLRDDVDLPIGEFGLWSLISWSYFFRTEFGQETPFALSALASLTQK